jgi:hypothetical protein
VGPPIAAKGARLPGPTEPQLAAREPLPCQAEGVTVRHIVEALAPWWDHMGQRQWAAREPPLYRGEAVTVRRIVGAAPSRDHGAGQRLVGAVVAPTRRIVVERSPTGRQVALCLGPAAEVRPVVHGEFRSKLLAVVRTAKPRVVAQSRDLAAPLPEAEVRLP